MLVDCLMQVYRIGFLVTSLPVNCNPLHETALLSPFTGLTKKGSQRII